MKIVKIEPTPSPNTLKIVLDYKRPDLTSVTYKEVEKSNPSFINDILKIDGVKSIFHALDFISIDKKPKFDFEQMLPSLKRVFDEEVVEVNEPTIDNGEMNVELLTFKDIPYQIKVTSSNEEFRKQLDVRFINAMLKAQKDSDNVVFMRKWVPFGVRFGDVDEIINSVKEEVDALFPQNRLDDLVTSGLMQEYIAEEKVLERFTIDAYLKEDDWKARYRMLDHYPDPDVTDIPLLTVVMQDSKPQIKRLCIALLGMIEDKAVLPLIHSAIEDKNLTIRRTAGDTISDLGFKESLPVMEKALNDKHPIVRWRAAMFLYDEGNESSLPYLEAHLEDEAFDVRLQVQMAYERIKNGEEAVGSVWKQMANRKGE